MGAVGRNVEVTITCDRCGCVMAREYGNEWILFKRNKRIFKLVHDVPAWDRTDEYLFCDSCAQSFKKWIVGKDDE